MMKRTMAPFEEIAGQTVPRPLTSGPAVAAAIPYARIERLLSRRPLRRTSRNRLLGDAPSFSDAQFAKWHVFRVCQFVRNSRWSLASAWHYIIECSRPGGSAISVAVHPALQP